MSPWKPQGTVLLQRLSCGEVLGAVLPAEVVVLALGRTAGRHKGTPSSTLPFSVPCSRSTCVFLLGLAMALYALLAQPGGPTDLR